MEQADKQTNSSQAEDRARKLQTLLLKGHRKQQAATCSASLSNAFSSRSRRLPGEIDEEALA